MRNVELSEQEMFELRDEVCKHIEESVDVAMAELINEGILKAMEGPDGKDTDKMDTRKCFVSLACAVATFLNALIDITNKTRPKEEWLTCERFGEEFSDHLDAFCCIHDYAREKRAKKGSGEE